jgi:hypothetical protein
MVALLPMFGPKLRPRTCVRLAANTSRSVAFLMGVIAPWSRRRFLAVVPAGLVTVSFVHFHPEQSRMGAELKPLYRVRFTYPDGWSIPLADAESAESQHFFFAEGRCEGRLHGRFRGANHPRRRGDGTFLPDFQGIIETEDGAVVYFDYQGYGRAYPVGRRQIVSSATHLSADERYRWLNDVVCVGTGEVRAEAGKTTELVVEVMELVWQPPAE